MTLFLTYRRFLLMRMPILVHSDVFAPSADILPGRAADGASPSELELCSELVCQVRRFLARAFRRRLQVLQDRASFGKTRTQ